MLALAVCLLGGQILPVYSQQKSLHFISTSHLDTQWNWDVKTTIDEYIPNTMTQNFALMEKYPDFRFNFEAAIHYMWMKEYYPTQYEKLKQYIQTGQWNVSGGSIDANDVMVPSAESIIRNFLYGQSFFKKEFGHKGGSDMMLPDCFGFPYSLPTLAKHCGVNGFHTQKLSWGSAYDYNSLAPFGIWRGVDGSELYAIFKGEPYDEHEKYNKDMSKDADMLNVVNSNQANYGVPFAFRYVGPRGDRGGSLIDNPTQTGENTPYWLQTSVNSDGPVKVSLSTPDQIFTLLNQYKNDKYFVWDNELPMSTHGVGCYTSQTIMKYWNRKNELLADATEKTSVFSDWIKGLDYPSDIIKESWVRLLWHHFHDDLTGTSIPNAYTYSYNDEVLVNLNLSKTLLNSVGAVARQMNTNVEGTPLVVYNPLSIQRNDIVEASIVVASRPENIRVLDGAGSEKLAQIVGYNENTKELSFIFEANVPSLGYAVYDLRLNEASSLESSLSVNTQKIENEIYTVTLNASGDVSSIYDKELGIELLMSPMRLAMFNDRSETFPSWEVQWSDVSTGPSTYVDENVAVSVVENGPLRVSLKVMRTKKGSEFVQYIRLTPSRISERIDFVNEIDWQTRGTLLKAIFPLKASNANATYDMSIGAITRGVNASNLYEVAGHQWADQTHSSGMYGVSILNDSKYGWDKPNINMLRLSLIHTPAVGDNYVYQKDQDLGLNKFTYSFYRHTGAWSEKTQWEASRLNQPMLAFQTPKHDGDLGQTVNFVSLNTDKVAVKALKKAEDSDEIVVRVYELIGESHNDVKITFPTNIVSAREINGIEEQIGTASFSGKELSLNIGKFQPKTFAVKLADADNAIESDVPTSVQVDLDYNIDVMSFDTRRNNVTSGVAYAYPAELLSDVIYSDGIGFKIGNRTNGAKNAVYGAGQTVTLPTVSGAKKLYILAGSKKEAGSVADFQLGGKKYSFNIPFYAGNVGVWETEYNLGTQYREDHVAFTATHRHDVSGNRNDSYNFMYMYQYSIPIEGDATSLVLPNDEDIYVFAVTISDNENDDIVAVSPLTSLPKYYDSGVANDCGERLEAETATASNQNGADEGPEKAIDQNLNTKWCVTNNNTPWLELTFKEPVEICRWFVLNAGSESSNSITKNFRLQTYKNGSWNDVDVVTNNTANKVNRSVEPFTTEKIRLQIDQGEQNGNVTRILEFAVFGKGGTISIEEGETASLNLQILSCSPNPVVDKTLITCSFPENVTTLKMDVCNLSGAVIDTKNYDVTTARGSYGIEWDSQHVQDGVYLYRVLAYNGAKLLSSAVSKMIVKH